MIRTTFTKLQQASRMHRLGLTLVFLGLFACATVPQAQVFQLSDGPRITIRQGCPIQIGENDLKRVTSDAYAINDRSVPSPEFFHGRLDPEDLSSYIIVMEAGSYEPGRFFCDSSSLHSFILIENVSDQGISIKPVNNWRAISGPEALKGYDRNVRQCKTFGSSWSKLYRGSTKYYSKPASLRVSGVDVAIVDPTTSNWTCEYHTDERSLAILLEVGGSSFVISKIVDDLYVTETK